LRCIDGCRFVEHVVKESLRLMPPAPLIGRTLTEATEACCAWLLRRWDSHVQLAGCLLPKGTDIAISIYSLHRHPDLWSDPDVFDPDRFITVCTCSCVDIGFVMYADTAAIHVSPVRTESTVLHWIAVRHA
jgi:cytochrome P450